MEDFALRMLDTYGGFTAGRLYPCFKVLPGVSIIVEGRPDRTTSCFLTIDDSGRAREIPIVRMGIEPDVFKYARQQLGLPEEIEKNLAPAL